MQSVDSLCVFRFPSSVLLLLLLTSAGCTSLFHTTPPVPPSNTHRAIARQFMSFTNTIPGHRTRELRNLYAGECAASRQWLGLTTNRTGPECLERLLGQRPSTSNQLDHASKIIAYLNEFLERIANTPDVPNLRAVRTPNPITLDGRLSEPDWTMTPPIPINHPFRIDKDRGKPHATARLLWDDRYLYVGFDVPDRDVAAFLFERDDDTFLWDAVECFILPDILRSEYWEICVTPTGGLTDRRCRKKLNGWSSTFDTRANLPGILHGGVTDGTVNQSGDTDKGYGVELAIPFYSLKGFGTPSPGKSFRTLLAVADLDGVPAVSNVLFRGHTVTPMGFQDIWSYSRVTLVDAP